MFSICPAVVQRPFAIPGTRTGGSHSRGTGAAPDVRFAELCRGKGDAPSLAGALLEQAEVVGGAIVEFSSRDSCVAVAIAITAACRGRSRLAETS